MSELAQSVTTQVDIVIPVYNEGDNILRTLAALERSVQSRSRVYLCYDFDEDNTLQALRNWDGRLELYAVKNRARGAHSAVMSGIAAGSSPFVLVFPADDDYNAGILDAMVAAAERGCDIVTATRFMPGGGMVGCPWLKALLVRTSAWALHFIARLPCRDASNGFRLFSRRLLNRAAVESTEGFTYSLELLAKCHRLRWPIGEVPARWFERSYGQSRFKVLRWVPSYLEWFSYVFQTTFLRKPPETVAPPLNTPAPPPVMRIEPIVVSPAEETAHQ